MRRHRLPLLALLALLAVGAAVSLAASAADPAASAPAAEAVVPSPEQLADPAWIADGRKRFIATCAYCHGQEGQAGKTASFKERPGWDPAKIHAVIANGRARAGNVMPAWKDSIPDAEIWKMVAYIKSLTPGETGGRP